MTARRVALLLTVVLAFYVLLVAGRAVTLIADGRPAFVLLGIGVLLLPLIAVWIVVMELRFGAASERLAREIAESDGSLAVDLPRTPSGRVSREAADAVFADRRAQAEASPEDWRVWYRLAIASGDAGDRMGGRRAMRRAIALHDRPGPGS